MERHFYLSAIGQGEFNNHCTELGIPPKAFSYKGSKRHLFAEITRPFFYKSFADVLSNATDEHQSPRCVWLPGDRRMKEAVIHTVNEREIYFEELLGKEKNFKRVVIQCSSNPMVVERRDADEFEFRMEGNEWILRYFFVRGCNFSLYQFEGIEAIRERDFSVFGVYPSKSVKVVPE